MNKKTIYQLVGEYANALGKCGPNSEQTTTIRLINASNKKFLEYADALDKIKKHLGGSGMNENISN